MGSTQSKSIVVAAVFAAVTFSRALAGQISTGDPMNRENIASLFSAARTASPVMCELASRAIDFSMFTTVRPPMLRGVVADTFWAQGAGTWAVNRIDGDDATAALLEGARDPNPCVRNLAIRLIGRTSSIGAGDVLVEMANSGSPDERESRRCRVGHSPYPGR